MADLDGDGIPEQLHVETIPRETTATPLLRLSIDRNNRQRYSGLFPGWKVAAQDVDADGRTEIVIALSKVDYRDKALRNRLYVYGWNNKLVDRWRGSRFPRPFIDFEFEQGRHGKAATLKLLEIDVDRRRFFLGRYRWLHFGFVKLDEQSINCSIAVPAGDLESWYAPGAIRGCSLQADR